MTVTEALQSPRNYPAGFFRYRSIALARGIGFCIMKSINPATEELLKEYPDHSSAQVQSALRATQSAFQTWRQTPMPTRAAHMHRAAQVLRQRSAEFSALMVREMGKPIAQAEGEIEKCALACDYFADHAAEYLAPQTIASDADRSYVRFDPLGAVLAIMPWNFPFWQVFRFAAPTLMAGNVAILKHAPNVPGCALAIEEIFRAAGFPPGVFATLLIDTPLVPSIIHDPIVAAVTLTGSGRAGAAVAAEAGKALKKAVLELGGSDPFIVLPDADVEATANAAAAARCINSGQSCIAAKRFIVVGESKQFENAFAQALADMKIGDPTDRSTQIGPLARLDLLENLQRQVQASIKSGARLVTGGHRLPKKGLFYAPTLLADIRPGMAAFDEETFGPVAALIPAKDVDEAVQLANRSQYGLGASIWTKETKLAESIAARIEAGSVFINGQVKSDPRLPFGGIKQSGYGRELSSFGIHEFVNIKTVWVKEVAQAGNASRVNEVNSETMTAGSLTDLKLSVHRALLGEVPGNLAALTVGSDGNSITLRGYFFEEPGEDDKESLECMASEVIADFPPGFTVKTEFHPLAAGTPKMAAYWAFIRSGVQVT